MSNSGYLSIDATRTGVSTPDENLNFCLEIAFPSIEDRTSQKLPHIIIKETCSDIMHQFYGLVIERASDFSATIDVAAHEATFLRYP